MTQQFMFLRQLKCCDAMTRVASTGVPRRRRSGEIGERNVERRAFGRSAPLNIGRSERVTGTSDALARVKHQHFPQSADKSITNQSGLCAADTLKRFSSTPRPTRAARPPPPLCNFGAPLCSAVSGARKDILRLFSAEHIGAKTRKKPKQGYLLRHAYYKSN